MTVLKFLSVAVVAVLTLHGASCGPPVNNRSYEHPYGQPLTIISFTDDKPIVVYDNDIKKLLHKELGDYKIAVYPIVGGFRMGKSFFMDYCLRFLYANYKSINYRDNPLSNPSNWMGDKNEPLSGFSWRPGTRGDTAGIVIWSDIFYYEEENGERVAIILMDTQGMFDVREKMDTSARIFTLNSLFASFLIFLNNGNLKEDAINYLGMVTEYAKLVHKMSDKEGKMNLQEKPFQDLLFLFRDWPFPDDHPYGLEGGTEYILEELKINESFDESKQQIRETIVDTYEKIYGFLLPHPGGIVSGKSGYLGHWDAMDEEFREHYFNLIEWVFKKENIVKKKVLGRELNGKEYYTYITAYSDIYKSSEFPQSPDIYNVTVDRQNKILLDEAFLVYTAAMQVHEVPNADVSVGDVNATLIRIHAENKAAAVELFKSKPKLGSTEVKEHYEQRLKDSLDAFFNEWSAKILIYYKSFNDLQKSANNTINTLMKQKKEELDRISQKHDQSVGEMSQNINQVTQQLENDRRLNDVKIEIQRQKLTDVQTLMDKSTKEQEKNIKEQKRQFGREVEKLKEEREAEEARRNEADRIRNEDFQRKVREMEAKNLKDSEAYEKLIKENARLIAEEKKQREAQDLLRAQEMERLRMRHQASEERIRAKISADRAEQERLESEITNQIIESMRMQQVTMQNYREMQKKFDAEMLEMKRKNDAELERIERSEQAEIARLRREHKERVEAEQRRIAAERARIEADIRRSNGGSSCVPNKLFMSALFGFLLVFAFLKV